jgi:hypothetical protein
MLFFINASVIVFFLAVIAIQISKHNRLTLNEFQYKYYELRDRLAMLVVNGQLDENSWEFNHLVNTINYHISVIDTVSFSRMLPVLSKYHASPGEARQVKIIKKKIDHPDVIELLADFFDVTANLIKYNSRMQLKIAQIFVNRAKLLKHTFVNRAKLLKQTLEYRDELRGALKRPAEVAC